MGYLSKATSTAPKRDNAERGSAAYRQELWLVACRGSSTRLHTVHCQMQQGHQGGRKWREAPVAVSSNNLHASSRSFCLRTLSFLSFICFLVTFFLAISLRPERTVSLPNTPHAVSYVLPTFHTLLESAEQGPAGRRIPVEQGGSKSGAHQWLNAKTMGLDNKFGTP